MWDVRCVIIDVGCEIFYVRCEMQDVRSLIWDERSFLCKMWDVRCDIFSWVERHCSFHTGTGMKCFNTHMKVSVASVRPSCNLLPLKTLDVEFCELLNGNTVLVSQGTCLYPIYKITHTKRAPIRDQRPYRCSSAPTSCRKQGFHVRWPDSRSEPEAATSM